MKKTMFNFMLALLPAMVFATSPAMAGDSKDLVNGYSENPSVAAYSATPVASGSGSSLITKNVTGNFSSLNISSNFVVTLNLGSSDNNSYAAVSVPEELERIVDARVVNGVLRLGVKPDNESQKIYRKYANSHKDFCFSATINMKRVESMDISGAAVINAKGESNNAGGAFSANFSGASSVSGLKITADKIKAIISGASSIDLNAVSTNTDLNISGAASFSADLKASEDINLEISGAVKTNIKAACKELDVEASGASVVNATGTAEELDLEASGAAKADFSGFQAMDCSTEVSGGSWVSVNVTGGKTDGRGIFKMSATGAGSIRYRAGEKVTVEVGEVSTGASVKKIK